MELDFLFDVIISRWRPWHHFTKSLCAHPAAYASSWSV